MRRHPGIRCTVLSALALPLAGLTLGSGALCVQALDDARTAARSGALAAAAPSLSQAGTALQAERLLTVRALAGEAGSRAALPAARARTDTWTATLDRALTAGQVRELSPGAAAAVERVARAHRRLASLRATADGGRPDADAVRQGYGEVVTAGVRLPAAVADSLADREQASRLTALTLLGQAGEAAAREQLTGLEIATAAVPTRIQLRSLARDSAEQEQSLAALREPATAATPGSVAAGAPGPADGATGAPAGLDRLRTRLVEGPAFGPASVTRQEWMAATGRRSAQLRAATLDVASRAAARAPEAGDEARRRLATILAATVALVGLSVLAGLRLSRALTSALSAVTADVTRALEDLPVAEDRPRAGATDGGPDGADPARNSSRPPAVAVRGNEIGRLSAALADLRERTLALAIEHDRVSDDATGTIVTVARRTQSLLTRQRALLDSLEQAGPGGAPATLASLDRLTARMLRAADGLLVLAGGDPGRRSREPVRLSEVIRTATRAVDGDRRVTPDLTVDPLVAAHLAAPVVHLLAELVDNAVTSSRPGSPVVVAARATGDGVRVTVRDEGPGLPAEELGRANARLADPAGARLIGAARLGLPVVARLAGRIGARVHLEAAEHLDQAPGTGTETGTGTGTGRGTGTGTGPGTVAVVDLAAVVFGAGPAVRPAPQPGVVRAARPIPQPTPVAMPVAIAVPAAEAAPVLAEPDPSFEELILPGTAAPSAPEQAIPDLGGPDRAGLPATGPVPADASGEPLPAQPEAEPAGAPPVAAEAVPGAGPAEPGSVPTMDVLPQRASASWGFRRGRRKQAPPPPPPPAPVSVGVPSPPRAAPAREPFRAPPAQLAWPLEPAVAGERSEPATAEERARSAIASQALSELSALSAGPARGEADGD